jgi:hypothetical protein
MAGTAAAVTAVKSHRILCAAAIHIMIAMTGAATTPLITALQYRPRIGVKFMIMPTMVAMQTTA